VTSDGCACTFMGQSGLAVITMLEQGGFAAAGCSRRCSRCLSVAVSRNRAAQQPAAAAQQHAGGGHSEGRARGACRVPGMPVSLDSGCVCGSPVLTGCCSVLSGLHWRIHRGRLAMVVCVPVHAGGHATRHPGTWWQHAERGRRTAAHSAGPHGSSAERGGNPHPGAGACHLQKLCCFRCRAARVSVITWHLCCMHGMHLGKAHTAQHASRVLSQLSTFGVWLNGSGTSAGGGGQPAAAGGSRGRLARLAAHHRAPQPEHRRQVPGAAPQNSTCATATSTAHLLPRTSPTAHLAALAGLPPHMKGG
jgi:hypothetical protein